MELPQVLKDSGHWYDFTIVSSGLGGITRRLAGRVENGQHSVSDPAMGMRTRRQAGLAAG